MEHKSFLYRGQWVVYDRDEKEYVIKLSDSTVTFPGPQQAREYIDKMLAKGQNL